MHLSPETLSLKHNTLTADCTCTYTPTSVGGSGTFLNANRNLLPQTALEALAEFLTEKMLLF